MSRSSESLDSTRRQVLAAMGGASVAGLAGCSDFFDDDFEGLVAAVGADPEGTDPSEINDAPSNAIYSHVYETLITQDFALDEFRGVLAEDWYEREDEDNVFRFELREGIEFHSGHEFTADDVEFSINRLENTVNAADVDWVEEVNVIDDYTVDVVAERPYGVWEVDLGAVFILPSDHDGLALDPADDDHDFDDESVGTGPFELVEYTPDDRVELQPFEDYWYDGDEFPHPTEVWDEGLRFEVVTETASQEEAISSGDVDVIDSAALWELDQWDDEDDAEVRSGDAVGHDFLAFPVSEEPFSDPRFRRGIVRMVDRDDIIENIFGGRATKMGQFISPGLGFYWDQDHEDALLDEWLGHDPDEGEDLIEAALEDADIEAPYEATIIVNEAELRDRWTEAIASSINDQTDLVEIDRDVQAFSDLVSYIEDEDGLAASDDEILALGWTGGSDPHGHIEDLVHSSNHVPDGNNWLLYENDEVDQLIDEGVETTIPEQRRDIYHDLQEVLAEEAPLVPVWQSDAVDVIRPSAFDNPEDWTPHPNSSYRFGSIYSPHAGVVVEPSD